MLNKDNEINYYYTDFYNKSGKFLAKKNFYFKCSNRYCTGLGMINDDDRIKIFKLTKKLILNILIAHIILKNIDQNNNEISKK